MTSQLDWLSAADALAAILAAENAALAAVDFAAATALLATKRAALATIAAAVMQGPKAPLRAAAERLDRLSDENRRLLSRAMGIQSQLLGMIAKAASAAPVGYGRDGRTAAAQAALAFSARA